MPRKIPSVKNAKPSSENGMPMIAPAWPMNARKQMSARRYALPAVEIDAEKNTFREEREAFERERHADDRARVAHERPQTDERAALRASSRRDRCREKYLP